LPGRVLGHIPGQFVPILKTIAGDLQSVLPIGLAPSDGIVPVAMNENGIDYET